VPAVDQVGQVRPERDLTGRVIVLATRGDAIECGGDIVAPPAERAVGGVRLVHAVREQLALPGEQASRICLCFVCDPRMLGCCTSRNGWPEGASALPSGTVATSTLP
jgi:hypothetical protein